MRAEIAIVTFSRIAQDSRVLRQCDLLAEMGLPPHVVAFGAPDDAIAYAFSRFPPPRPTAWNRLSTAARQLPARLPGPLGDHAATAGFWAARRHRWALGRLRLVRPKLVLANDWPALVVAARWRAEAGAEVHYDSHEFAAHEFDDRLWWRLVHKAFATRLERMAITAAAGVSTVGRGLAAALREHHGLARLPTVVRSIPDRAAMASAPAHWPLRLLYHGAVRPDRGLDTLIGVLARLATPHTAVIRGAGSAPYLRELRGLAERSGVAARIRFEPPVPPGEVVAAAADADVGVFLPPLRTPQQRLCLPNKLFEYVAAGLAVVVTPGAELRALVEEFGFGLVSRDPSVAAVAEALDALTPEKVAALRGAAGAAARVLTWENEKTALAAALGEACARAGLSGEVGAGP